MVHIFLVCYRQLRHSFMFESMGLIDSTCMEDRTVMKTCIGGQMLNSTVSNWVAWLSCCQNWYSLFLLFFSPAFLNIHNIQFFLLACLLLSIAVIISFEVNFLKSLKISERLPLAVLTIKWIWLLIIHQPCGLSPLLLDDGYKMRDQYAEYFITFAPRLSVVFRRITTEANDNPDCVWYWKTYCPC